MLSLPSVKIHASCRIGSNAISSEGTASFAEANLSSSLDQDQGKHLAFPFNRFFCFGTLYVIFMIVHLHVGVY
jgi:hypothetical protein